MRQEVEIQMLQTPFTALTGIQYPIIQAGMAGGLTTADMVVAVSNAGGLGTIGAGYLSPDQLQVEIRKVRERTDKPFAVNLFAPQEIVTIEEDVRAMMDYLNLIRAELGLEPDVSLGKIAESFDEQIAVVLAERVPVFSFTFGIPNQDVLTQLRQQGTIIIGTATTVTEAAWL